VEYTINKLASIAGISTRTLRYYDEIGLLRPVRKSSSGYRIYGQAEVDRLQEILLYRTMELPLERISVLLQAKETNRVKTLELHLEALTQKQSQIQEIIATVEKTLANEKGLCEMSDKEKFEGFKERLLTENEEMYGNEIREKYGEDVVQKSNEKWLNMSDKDFTAMNALQDKILEKLKQAVIENLPAESETGLEIAELHKQWLSYTWAKYNEDAHYGLVQMYIDDTRFTAYYDNNAIDGAALFLRNAVHYMLTSK